MVAALAVGACSSTSTGKTQTTAAKVDAARNDALARLDNSAQGLTELTGQIPATIASRTQCVVAIPSLVKAGFIVGGESGKGFATCETSAGWSAPAPITIGGGTLGAQIGGESTDVVALVTTERGKQALLTGNFKVGADAAATAGPVGAAAGTDVGRNADVVSYSRSKGLFAGATLNGTTIKPDKDATNALYGSPVALSTILGGQVAPPEAPATQRFLTAVRTGFGAGRGSTPQASIAPR
jgi:lipid-binding SYLF domain-containing protein